MGLFKWSCFSLVVIFFAVYFYSIDLEQYPILDTTSLIESHGYQSEEHLITTEDGVNLKIFRLLPPKNVSVLSTKRRHPVLIVPGLFCTSDVLVTGGKKDLAFILVDRGYDVWLANVRGNQYGQVNSSHIDLGIHEYTLDLAAVFDHVLQTNGEKKLAVAPLSAGCPYVLALLAYRPEYNNKVSVVLNFAPAIAVKTVTLVNKLFYATYYVPAITEAFMRLLDGWQYRTWFAKNLCQLSPSVCRAMIDSGCGHPEPDNADLSGIILSVFPAGYGVGSSGHLVQHSPSDIELQMRDYGKEENLKRYNSTTPPNYNSLAITSPQKLYLSKHDTVIFTETPRAVYRRMPKYLGEYLVEDETFAHSNFVMNSIKNPKFVEDVLKTLVNLTR